MSEFSIPNEISGFFVVSGIVVALGIAYDLYRNPQPMKIMNYVWILTGLWGSYPALFAYFSFGRANKKNMDMPMKDGKMDMSKPMDMPMKDGKMDMSKPMDRTEERRVGKEC